VDHFGVELHRINALFIIGDHGIGRAGAGRHRAETGASAVTLSPWLIHT
jgi:tRNA pseudouridine-54 N-methylase